MAAGDSDPDGISVGASALTLNGGDIEDASGNDAALGLGTRAITDGDLTVDAAAADAVAPAVVGAALSGTGQGANGAFIAGDRIEVTVAFDEAVTVTGMPQAALAVGAHTRPAAYASGSGTTSLVFRYTVAAGDSDPDGVSVSSLALNGGRITDGAAAPNAAALALGAHAIEDAAGFAVDGDGADASPAFVTGVTVSGAARGENGVFVAGDRIEVAVAFSEAVTVTGIPQVGIAVGSALRQADYRSGSGTASLSFRYRVARADRDADGISIGASALTLNGGTIADAANGENAAALDLGAHAVSDGDAAVDGSAAPAVRPMVTGLAIGGRPTGAGGVFGRTTGSK